MNDTAAPTMVVTNTAEDAEKIILLGVLYALDHGIECATVKLAFKKLAGEIQSWGKSGEGIQPFRPKLSVVYPPLTQLRLPLEYRP